MRLLREMAEVVQVQDAPKRPDGRKQIHLIYWKHGKLEDIWEVPESRLVYYSRRFRKVHPTAMTDKVYSKDLG